MKLNYEGRISRVESEEGITFSIAANWDEDVRVEGNTLVEAQRLFSERLAERGIDANVVKYKMELR